MSKSLEDFSPDDLAQMAATYHSLLNNPETREVTLRATKRLNPGLSIPEVDLKDQTRGAILETNQRIEAQQQQLLKLEAERRIERERDSLRDQGFSKAQITEIENIMTTEQIPSYGTAAKYYSNAQRVAEPTPNTGEAERGTTWSLPSEQLAAAKSGKAGLSKFARTAAEQALSDIRSGRIKLQ